MLRNIANKNIMVTGGAGFIGSHLVDELLNQGARKVVVVDNMFLGNERNLTKALNEPERFVLYKEDAELSSSLEYILQNEEIEIVFNCATKALNYSFINPQNAYMTNVNIISNLLEFLRKGYYETLCHFSTSEVYGTAIYEPMDEKHPFHPTTTYAAGKAAADLMLESYVNIFDVDAFIVRPFNNYGPRQNYVGKLAGVIPITISKIYNGQIPEIHGTGEQKRDFIFVKDTVRLVLELFSKIGKGESVNVSANGMVSILELINTIAKIMQYNGGDYIFKSRRTADVDSHCASNEKMLSLIPCTFLSLEEGLKETINWYINEFSAK